MTNRFIPLSVPNLKGNEVEYVKHAVETEWVSTAGSYVSDFEKAVSEYVKTPGAVACQSGTAGLHIALMLCGVERNDMVIVPTLTFIAAVNPVRYIGAEPIFMDCDDSLCIDPIKLEQFCKEECEIKNNVLYHKITGSRIPAMVVVHVFGNMADMEKIVAVAKNYHIKIVEDATEALGTKYTDGAYSGRFAGTIGDMGVYSFNGNKIITTGGGGMIVSNDRSMLAHAKHLTTQAKADELNFIHDEIGYNYRLTNLQAALGLAQMEQLETFIEIKIKNYECYHSQISSIPGLSMLGFRENTRSNHWFYSVFCDPVYPFDRDSLIHRLGEKKIQCRPIWGLIHQQKPYEGNMSFEIDKALYYNKHIVNIPCSTNLTEQDVQCVIEQLR
ncbi:MAG: LegC family aminotransferase [Lachnospiraceae bacterium]|jgi:perosamine synthetase|nr:LegC family aminotransferase [Lachnospiraceae bacterium]